MKSRRSPNKTRDIQQTKIRHSRTSKSSPHRKHLFTSWFENLEPRLALSAQPFVGGDIIIYRVGDGSVALTNGGNPIFLDEYTPSGVLVQSIEMPFSTNAGDTQGNPPVTSPTPTPNPIVNAGSATPSGVITLSQDGRYLTFAGYAANLPNNTGTNLKGSNFARDVGRVDISGNLDTSTAPIDYAGANTTGSSRSTPAGAISTDGSHFYIYSQQIDALRYANLGATLSSTPLGPLGTSGTHISSAQIYDGQLYGMGTDGKIYHVGAGLPTSGTPTLTNIPFSDAPSGLPTTPTKPVDFFFVTLNPSAHPSQPTAADTLYVTDPSATYTSGGTKTGEIVKYAATAWDPTTGAPTAFAFKGFIQVDPTNDKGAVTGLTGYSTGTSVVIYATSGAYNANAGQYGGALFSYTDVLANDTGGSLPSTATATSLLPFFRANNFNQGFRGVAFVPNQAPTLTGGTYNFPAILENPASNPGQLVSAVIAGLGVNSITDSSSSQHQGIAITAADQSNGIWQYSLNGGTSWQNFPAVSSTSALTLASDASTKLRFVPNTNYNGSATFSFAAWDQSEGTNGATFDIVDLNAPTGTSPFSAATATASQSVTFVNQSPTFVRGPSQSILDTAGPQSIPGWATGLGPGAANESGQALNFVVVSNTNSALFTGGGQPSIDAATGALSYTPAAGQSGTTTITVKLHDDGGTANGGHDDSATQTFQITVTLPGENRPPINLIPFAPQTTLENAPKTFSGTAISVSDPDAGSSSIQVTLTVTGGTATLSGLTGLTGSGNGTSSMTYQGTIADLNAALSNLVYTPTANLSGVAAGQITIATDDLGNTGTGGNKTATDSITINITPVNQMPSFTSGGNVTVAASGSPYSAPWATAISAGANESGQTLHFIVTNNNPTAFQVQPSVSPSGVLTFTPLYGPASTTTVQVQLVDDGGVANGGQDTFPSPTSYVTFLINQTQVNLAPVNTVPGTQRLIKNTPLVFSSSVFNQVVANEHNGIFYNDPDSGASTEQINLTATHGTLTLSTTSGLTFVDGTANNSASIHIKGTQTALNTALDGLTFTPTSGFTGSGAGGASITVLANDLSAIAPTNQTASSTINIDVVNPPPLEISELYVNPPGAPDHPNQYIEIRSIDPATGNSLPNYTIPSGTYLASVSGSLISVTAGSTITNYSTGTIVDTFDLGGMQTGNNGYLVLLENGNTYNDDLADGLGLGLIDPLARVYDNGLVDTVTTDGGGNITGHFYSPAFGTGAGFGNNFTAPGSSIVGHSSLFRPNDVDIYKGSASFVLFSAPVAPMPGDSLDSPLNVAPTGTLHGSEFDSWTVYDSVGATIPTQTLQGDISYGFINYNDNSLAGVTNHSTQNSTIINSPFTSDYFARSSNRAGWVATDWIGTSGLDGVVPLWGTGSKNNTVPNAGAKRPLNSIGAANFDNSAANHLVTTGSVLNYVVSNPAPTSQVIDPAVTVSTSSTDDANFQIAPNLYFPGSATVSISANYNQTSDSLGFADTTNIKGSFDSSTGILTLTGDDTFDNWNAALRSVTFNYSGTAVDTLHSTRTISFASNNGSVLSNVATRTIQLLGPAVIPPIVTGTSQTPLTWTEQLTPAAQVITIAPNLLVPPSDVGDTNRDGHRTVADVGTLMGGLRDLTTYQTAFSSQGDMQARSDANNDGFINNRDLQSLIVLLANNPGDSGQLTSATVAITGNFESAEDVLGWDAAVATANNITVTQSAHSQHLTLTPTMPDTSEPLANFQAVLRTVTYSNTSANPSTAPRTIAFSVIDTNNISSNITPASQQTINIVAVNNPAKVTTSGGSDSYTSGAAAILVDGALAVTDPDSATLTGATVSISGGFTAGDTLAFTNQLGISGSYNAASGVLTLTGTAPPLDYQVALRAITFSTSAGSGTRTISFTANDGNGNGNSATKDVIVQASGGGAAGGGSLEFASAASAPSSAPSLLCATISPTIIVNASSSPSSKRVSGHASLTAGSSKTPTSAHTDRALATTASHHARHGHPAAALPDILDQLFAKWH
jgi:hypothetical protein